MDNYSVLERNVLSGLLTRAGQRAFMFAREHLKDDRYAYKAESFAHEVEQIGGVLDYCLEAANRTSHLCLVPETLSDLRKFILSRHSNYCLPNARKDWTKSPLKEKEAAA